MKFTQVLLSAAGVLGAANAAYPVNSYMDLTNGSKPIPNTPRSIDSYPSLRSG